MQETDAGCLIGFIQNLLASIGSLIQHRVSSIQYQIHLVKI